MKTSTDFILTTHVGSLPRPKALEEKLLKQEMGVLSEEEAATMPAEVSDAVKWAVQRQRDMGITVIDDGEMSKYAYSTYARQRMTGLTGSDQLLAISDIMDFPEFAKRMKLEIKTPACVGPVSYLETDALRADIANLQAALAGSGAEEGVRRQNIRHRSRRKLAEGGPRLGLGFRRRACGVASADARWSFA